MDARKGGPGKSLGMKTKPDAFQRSSRRLGAPNPDHCPSRGIEKVRWGGGKGLEIKDEQREDRGACNEK